MISFCKIFYVSFIEFLVLLYFLYRYFMWSDSNVSLVIIPPLRGTYHIFTDDSKTKPVHRENVSRDKKTTGIIDEPQYCFQPAIQGTAEHFKQRHAGHQQFLTESRQTVADRP